MKFKGDIIITDPCYIDNNGEINLGDSDKIDIFDGSGLSNFGFSDYIWESTLYGDWSCTTFHLKEEFADENIDLLIDSDFYEEPLGNFCADAGLVGVFLLDEVLKFNPNFNYHIERPWTTTWIKDFDGEIEYIIYNDEVFIRGFGNVNFITRQTF